MLLVSIWSHRGDTISKIEETSIIITMQVMVLIKYSSENPSLARLPTSDFLIIFKKIEMEYNYKFIFDIVSQDMHFNQQIEGVYVLCGLMQHRDTRHHLVKYVFFNKITLVRHCYHFT